MKFSKNTFWSSGKYFVAAIMLILSNPSLATSLNPIIDDFSDSTNNNLGLPRQFLNDTMSGGQTQTESNVANGVIYLKGEIAPPRGQPGWASTVLLLDPTGMPRDASQFNGIKMRVKINSGNLSVSANSTEITNFDYHASPVAVLPDGQFHDVKIPFSQMKRAWSEQTELNTKTINSLSIVAFGLQPTEFDFAIDEVSFY